MLAKRMRVVYVARYLHINLTSCHQDLKAKILSLEISAVSPSISSFFPYGVNRSELALAGLPKNRRMILIGLEFKAGRKSSLDYLVCSQGNIDSILLDG